MVLPTMVPVKFSIPTEDLTIDEYDARYQWLQYTFGDPNMGNGWYVDIQPLLEEFVLSREIYFLYKARWKDV